MEPPGNGTSSAIVTPGGGLPGDPVSVGWILVTPHALPASCGTATMVSPLRACWLTDGRAPAVDWSEGPPTAAANVVSPTVACGGVPGSKAGGTAQGLSIVLAKGNGRCENGYRLTVHSSFDRLRMSGLPHRSSIIEWPWHEAQGLFKVAFVIASEAWQSRAGSRVRTDETILPPAIVAWLHSSQ